MQIELNSKAFWIDWIDRWEADAGKRLGVTSVRAEETIRRIAPDDLWVLSMPSFFNPRRSFFSFNYVTHISVIRPPNPAPAGARQQEQQNENRNYLLVISIAIMGITLGALGYLIASLKRANAASENTNRFLTATQNPQLPPIYQQIHQMLMLRKEVEERELGKIINYLGATVVTLLGAASLGVGVYSALPFLVTAGTVAIIAGGLFAIFNLGLHWDDASLNEEAFRLIVGYQRGTQTVDGLAIRIKRDLAQYNEQMIPGNVSSEEGFPPPMFDSLPQVNPGGLLPSAPDLI